MSTPADKTVREAIRDLPDRLAAPAERWLDRMIADHPQFPGELDVAADNLARLVRLIATSEFAGATINRHYAWFARALKHGRLSAAPERDRLRAFAHEIAASDDGVEPVQRALRQFRDRWLTRVLWRSLDDTVEIEETLASFG